MVILQIILKINCKKINKLDKTLEFCYTTLKY